MQCINPARADTICPAMRRSIKHLWYVWFFDLPRDFSAAQIEAFQQRIDARLERHAKWIGVAMTIVIWAAGWIGGVYFATRPAWFLMSLGLHRRVAYGIAALFTSVAGCLLGALVVYLIALMIGRRPWIIAARHAVRDIGRDVCVRCGYWLRGLADDVPACPECGMKRESMPDVLTGAEEGAANALKK